MKIGEHPRAGKPTVQGAETPFTEKLPTMARFDMRDLLRPYFRRGRCASGVHRVPGELRARLRRGGADRSRA